MTQNNLGNALRSLGERESGTVRLEEAVAAFRDALREHTRDRAPRDWAMTQNNLGNALRSLGERESGTARLEEAAAAYRHALREFTRDGDPLRWAKSYGGLSVALIRIAERKKDAALAAQAVKQLNDAHETCRTGGHAPAAAYLENKLSEARAVLNRLRKAS
jgi:tetratricopeptide (TPR) repeat protein